MKNFGNKKIRNDIILALSLVALAAIAFVLFLSFAKEGSVAHVTVDGKTYARLSLSEDKELQVIGENGAVNTVTVKDGKAFVTAADCPDKICVSHRPIKNVGDPIVCLPHKLVVTIEGESSDGVDVVS